LLAVDTTIERSNMTENDYLELLPPAVDAYEFEERAAIIEFENNKTRTEAEKIAFKMIINELIEKQI
jgi:hypothetical protein